MSDRPYSPQICTFIEQLERLDPGERACLKRNAGKTLVEARDTALALFYRVLPPGVPELQEETYFLVATLYPLVEAGRTGNLGDALRRVRTMTESTRGLDHRVRILLDADSTQLPFRLRQVIQYLASARIPVNWAELLQALLYWDHPKRWVQREWARAYFTGPSPVE